MTRRSVSWYETTAPRKGTLSARIGSCELMVTPSSDRHGNAFRWELRRYGSTEKLGLNTNKAKAKAAVSNAARNCGPNLGYHRKQKRKKRGRR